MIYDISDYSKKKTSDTVSSPFLSFAIGSLQPVRTVGHFSQQYFRPNIFRAYNYVAGSTQHLPTRKPLLTTIKYRPLTFFACAYVGYESPQRKTSSGKITKTKMADRKVYLVICDSFPVLFGFILGKEVRDNPNIAHRLPALRWGFT